MTWCWRKEIFVLMLICSVYIPAVPSYLSFFSMTLFPCLFSHTSSTFLPFSFVVFFLLPVFKQLLSCLFLHFSIFLHLFFSFSHSFCSFSSCYHATGHPEDGLLSQFLTLVSNAKLHCLLLSVHMAGSRPHYTTPLVHSINDLSFQLGTTQ